MKKIKSTIAAILIMALSVSTATPALAKTVSALEKRSVSSTRAMGRTPLYKASPDSFFETDLSVDINTEKEIDELSIQRDAEENQVVFEVSGTTTERISFYMKRNSTTNQITLPDPITVTIRQISGSPVGEIDVSVSPELNQDRTRIRISKEKYAFLSQDTPVSFHVSFVDENIGDKNDKPSGASNQFYIEITANSGFSKKLFVMYGADGYYTHYSSEYINFYKGTVINNKYVNIGEVNLNQAEAPSFTIEHYYKPLPGTEDAAIEEIQLNPSGRFTFADGSYTMDNIDKKEGWIAIPLRMKPDSFQTLKKEAVAKGQSIQIYSVLSDLVIVYDDGYSGQLGYMAGGVEKPLPLVYHITYSKEFPYLPDGSGSSGSHGSSGGSGGGHGSSGGSGGGSGSSGGSSGGGAGNSGSSSSATGPGSSATVVGPVQTARTTYAAQNDVGWKEINGFWYYINAENVPVTDWLYGIDGKWYYLGQDGIRKTGWALVDGKWYFLNLTDGSMTTGFLLLNQQWYLFNPDGSMATGWAKDPAGNWRYLSENGIMLIGATTPDGYMIGSDGIWRP